MCGRRDVAAINPEHHHHHHHRQLSSALLPWPGLAQGASQSLLQGSCNVARSPHSAVFPGIARTRFVAQHSTHFTHTHSHLFNSILSSRHTRQHDTPPQRMTTLTTTSRLRLRPLLIPQVVDTLVAQASSSSSSLHCNMLRDCHVASCPTYQHRVSWQTSLVLSLVLSLFLPFFTNYRTNTFCKR